MHFPLRLCKFLERYSVIQRKCDMVIKKGKGKSVVEKTGRQYVLSKLNRYTGYNLLRSEPTSSKAYLEITRKLTFGMAFPGRWLWKNRTLRRLPRSRT